MNLARYELEADESLTNFEFISEGNNGKIPKVISFAETSVNKMYNLAFGDKDAETGEIDDRAISNNGDTEKVLATVISAVYAFTKDNPFATVFATGSTVARNRLYRMGISKHYDEAIKDFYIYGSPDGLRWVAFEKNIDYIAFLMKRKI